MGETDIVCGCVYSCRWVILKINFKNGIMRIFNLNLNDIKDKGMIEVRGGRRFTNTAGILNSSLMSCQKKKKKTPSCFLFLFLYLRYEPETMTLNLSSLLSASARCYLTLSACRLCWWWTWCLRYYWSHNLIHLMHRVHGALSNRIGDTLYNLFRQQIKFGMNAGAGEQNLFCSQWNKKIRFVSLFPRIHSWFLLKAARNARWHTADWRALSCSTPSV